MKDLTRTDLKEIVVYGIKPGCYFASKDGLIYSKYTGRTMTTNSLDKDGYSRPSFCTIDGKSKRVHAHRLILATFAPVEGWETLEVNHKDGDKTNNSLDNLEWMTTKENIHHAWATGLARGGENHGRATMTEETALKCIELYKQGLKIAVIARQFGLNRSTVSQMIHGKNWKYLPR